MRSHRFSDDLFIAVRKDGTVANGANHSGPKLYVYESVAIKKAGKGGKVYFVSDTQVAQVWPKVEPKTFFLNERHEVRVNVPREPDPYSICDCGKASCCMCGYD